MPKIGYFLSCEQFGPAELVDQAKRAEVAGFDALWISDHFHPWNDEQGRPQLRQYLDAGIDEVYVQQIGPDMDGFFAAYEKKVLPQLR